MRNPFFCCRAFSVCLLLTACLVGVTGSARAQAPGATLVRTAASSAPIAFEENRGQTDKAVRFVSHGRTYTLFLAPTEAVLAPRGAGATRVRMRLGGAAGSPNIAGRDPLPGKVYYASSSATGPLTAAATFARVRAASVYKGIDLDYYGKDGALEFDFTVAPHADAGQIRLAFDGADALAVDDRGDLAIHAGADQIVLQAPIVYQLRDGVRREVAGRYVVTGSRGREVRFALAEYDRSLPLVIDPTIVYATYAGGAGDESIVRTAVNRAGEIYLFGTTTALPAPSPATQIVQGPTDAQYQPLYCFLEKLSSDASQALYRVYFQGFRDCEAFTVAPSGRIHLALRAPYNFGGFVQLRTLYGDDDSGAAFALVPLNGGATGAIDGRPSVVRDIKADSSNNVYVLYQQLVQADSALQSRLLKLDNGGQPIETPFDVGFYDSTDFPGLGDEAVAMAIDEFGGVFVTGNTRGYFPTTAGAFQEQAPPSLASGDVFLTQIATAHGPWTTVYGTLVGGSLRDTARGVVRDPLGFVYLTGRTLSDDFPMAASALFDEPNLAQGAGDGFVMKFDLTRSGTSQLVAGTFLGVELIGPTFGRRDATNPLVVLPGGEVAVTGYGVGVLLNSQVFDATGTIAAPPFVYLFSSDLSGLMVGTHLDNTGQAAYALIGASGANDGSAASLNAARSLFAVIETTDDARSTPGSAQPASGGNTDLLVSKIDLSDIVTNIPPILDLGPDRAIIASGGTASFDLAAAPYSIGDPDGVIVSYRWQIDGNQPIVYGEPYSASVLLEPGPHVLTLAVTDGDGATTSDTVVLQVDTANHAPTADAGPDINAVATSPAGATVIVFGNVTDPDNDLVTVTWAGPFPTQEFDVSAFFSGNAAVYLPLPIGVSVATLTVDDHHGHVVTDSVTITVSGTNTAIGSGITADAVDDRVARTSGFTPGRAKLTFDSVTSGGLAWLHTRTDQTPPPPAGRQLGSAPYYYDVAFTGAGSGNVRLCVDTTGMSFVSTGTPRVYRLNGGTWTDVSVASTPADTSAHLVCGSVPFFTSGTFAVLTPADENTRVTTIMTANTNGFIDGGAVFDAPHHYLYAGKDNTIVRIDLLTNAQTTIAGNGGSFSDRQYNVDALSTPIFNFGSMAVDSAGNVFGADANGCGIIRLEPRNNFTSYFLTRIAGQGPDPATFECHSGGDGGPAAAADVAVSGPMAFDQAGHLFFVQNDFLNGYTLRRIARGTDGIVSGAADEIITTVAGGGSIWPAIGDPHQVGFGGSLLGLTFHPNGDLYLALSSGIVRLTPAPGQTLIDGRPGEALVNVSGNGILQFKPFQGDQGPAISADWNGAYSIVFQPNGDLIAADSWISRLRRITAGADGVVNGGADEVISTIAGFSENFEPVFNGDGYALSTSFYSPRHVLADPRGGLLVVDSGNSRLRRIGLPIDVGGAGADLGVAVSASPQTVDTGGTVTYTVTATNHGPQTATGIGVSMPVAGGLGATATSPAGFCVVPILQFFGTIACDAGTLAPGQSITITITLTPQAPGPLTTTVTVGSQTTDPVSANNEATTTVEVVDRVAPTAVISVPLTVFVGSNLTASGAASTDAGGGHIVRYVWTLLERSQTIETTTPTVTFTPLPLQPLSAGVYHIQLVVYDDSGNASAPALGTIEIVVPPSLTAANDTYTVGRDSTLAAGGFLAATIPFSQEPLLNVTNVNGTVYFIEGCRLRKSDGTAAGTVLLKSNVCGGNLTNVNGTLYFSSGFGQAGGEELWKTDGTVAGTVMVKDIVAGNLSASPRELTNVNGTLFFIVNTVDSVGTITGSELWRSDGTPEGTMLVKALARQPSPYFMRDVNGTAYFRTTGGATAGLWKSDGTPEGTVEVKPSIRVGGSDDHPGVMPYPNRPVVLNGAYVFQGGTLVGNPSDLWTSDPVEGAKLLFAINPQADHSRFMTDFAAVNGRLYFGIVDAVYPQDLYDECVAINGDQFCSINPPVVYTREVWTSDGTTAGTTQIKVFGPFNNTGPGDDPFFFTGAGGITYFNEERKLWKTDGTPAGTTLVKDLFVGDSFSSPQPYQFVDAGGALYFVGRQNGNYGIWKSDGTEAGTVLLQAASAGFGASNLTSMNGVVFFTTGASTGRQLWIVGSAQNVLTNDALQTTNPTSVTIGQTTTHGTLTLTPAGAFLYRPADGFVGDDSFTYTVSDGILTSNIATATIHVTAPPPTVSVSDAAVVEGNSGPRTLTFSVTRTGDLSGTSSVSFATADGSAVAGSDYASQSGTLTFTPGQSSQTIGVPVIADTVGELDETFLVNLSGATGATIARGRAFGTIVNDDVDTDLQIAVTGASSVGVGGTIHYQVVVTNNGPQAATLVGVSLPVSAFQAASVDATSPAGFCVVPLLFLGASGNVGCDAGTLAAHASITITVDLTLKSTFTVGPLSSTFTVAGHEHDPVAANNTATIDTELEPGIDLELVPLSPGSGATVTVGVPVTYRVRLTNHGPYSSFVSRINFAPPAGLQFVSAIMPGAVCEFVGFLVCDTGDLGAGASVDLTVVATPLATGPTAATFVASSPNFDLNNANNTITIDVNRAPIANAGTDQNIQASSTTGTGFFFLRGGDSADPDGDGLTYTWTENGASVGTGAQIEQTRPIGNYVYSLTVNDGRGGVTSDTVVVIVHGSGLAAPANVSAVASSPGTVTVTWDPVAGAAGYRVFRGPDPITVALPTGGAPIYVLIGTPASADTASTPFVDSGLPTLVRQYYAVEAINGSIASLPTPASDAVTVTAPPEAEIFGFADFHNHQFSNLGFGRNLIWGNAFSTSPLGIFDALPSCEELHGPNGLLDLVGNLKASAPGGLPVPALTAIPPLVLTTPSGPPVITPPIPWLTSGHHTGGTAQNGGIRFDGWPRWNTITHQQVYYEWLKRAFDGGMRLMVVHALNNKLLCEVAGQANGNAGHFSCNDMDNIDDQLNMAKSLEAFIDTKSGGPGKGWYQIAYSGEEARHIINNGKMAIILGIEVDDLFGCSLTSNCTEDQVRAQLDHYHQLGVRHLFPVHAFDNAFGGTALYDPLFNVGQKITEGSFVVPRDCKSEGYDYKSNGVGAVAALLQLQNPAANTFAAECNARPLTSLGRFLIKEMMQRGMIIDIDHMSALTANAVLDVAEQYHYAGIISGHSGSTVVQYGNNNSEGAKTHTQLSRIHGLGGVSGVFIGQGARELGNGSSGVGQHSNGFVINDCSNSSKTFAQAYLAAIDAFGGPGSAAVGIGTDFNGLAMMPGPRFGPESCYGDNPQIPQGNMVTYPLSIFAKGGVNAGHLSISGQPDRSIRNNPFDPFENPHPAAWDYNFDGLAHVGLLPDFIQDLRQVGLSDAQLQPLFRSAEGYIRMWERAEASAPVVTPPPGITITATEQSGARGNASSDLHNFLLGGSAADPGTATPLTAQVNGVDANDQTLFPLGVTAVTFRFADAAGHVGSATATVNVSGGFGSIVRDNNVPVQLLDSLGTTQAVTIAFANLLQEGFATADVMTIFPALPVDVFALTPVYNIVTTALYDSVVTVCLQGSAFGPNDRLLHYEGAAWRDVTRSATALEVCGLVSSLSPFVAVRPKNHPPVAGAGTYPPFEATSPAGASVTLAGTGSDPDPGDTLSFLWKEGTTTLGSGKAITVVLPLGGHDVTLTVTDNHGAAATSSASVIVRDTTPPTIVPPPNQSATATGNSGVSVTYPAPVVTDTASGVASFGCVPASGSVFPVGATTVTCSAADVAGNTRTATFTVTVSVAAQSPDGLMAGAGSVNDGSRQHSFAFEVWQRNGRDGGQLVYAINEGRVIKGSFEATAINDVTLSDDPSIRPGPALGGPLPFDTVRIKGVGKWNGKTGYSFEATAADLGEPGARRDTFSIVIKDSKGIVVATVNGSLSAGNIQATGIIR